MFALGRYLKCVACAAALFIGGADSWPAAQRLTMVSDYQVTTWGTAEGLPHPSVLALAQTPDGYIWCGTEHGLARFDGVKFSVLDSQSTPELGNGQIRSLYVDRRGALWIATRDGRLVRLFEQVFTAFFPPKQSNLKQAILNLADDENGTLWLMPEDFSVLRFADGQFETASTRWPGGPGFNVRAGFDGAVWIGTSSGAALFRLEHGVPQNALSGEPVHYQFHAPSHTGGYWFSHEGRLGLWRNGAWLWRGAPGQLRSDAWLEWGVEDNQTRLWLASLGAGVYAFDTNGATLHFTTREGLASDYTHFALADREDNLWIATENGLSRIRPALFRMHDRREGLTADRVAGVCPAPGGGLWAATDGGGLHRLSEAGFCAVTNGPSLPLTTTVLLDSAGTLWVGTHGEGLFRSQAGPFVREDAAPLAEDLSALFEDSRKQLWVGQRALNLVARRNPDGTWSGVTLPNPEPIADVRCFAEDEAGAIWAGSCGNGLFRWDGRQWTRFTRANGLPSDLVWTLHFDAEDRSLWIGTAGGGLARWKNQRFSVCDMAHGLWDNTVSQLIDDGLGNFWMGSHRGIFHVSKSSLRRFMDGQQSRIHSTAYGLSDGLTTLICSSGFQPAGCRTPDGKLWFATMRGLASIDPRSVQASTHPPLVRLERVLLDGEEIRHPRLRFAGKNQAPAFNIPPGAHRCEFQYTGLSLTAPEAVQFKYRLEGLEPDWIEAGTSRSATYSRLPPGDYRFLVTAANRDGVWSPAETSLRFRVQPTLWQTGWFRFLGLAAATLGLVAAGGLTARQRARRRLAELAQAHALETERTRIAKDIHDNLGSGLTHIAWLSDLAIADAAQPDKVRVHTTKIARQAQEMVESLDETVWAVSPQNDTLESLVEYVTGCANERLQPMEIHCRIDAPADLRQVPLSAEARHDLYLAIKEALNNLVKYAAAKNVRIAFGLEGGHLVISVADDGRGFDPAITPARGGHGLANLRSRLEKHGGQFTCHTARGRGTRLQFRLPLQLAACPLHTGRQASSALPQTGMSAPSEKAARPEQTDL